jgi:hypothetical protein
MKEIKLTQGKFTQVDDEDYEYLNQFKWCAVKGGKTFYAQRSVILINKLKRSTRMHNIIMNTPENFEIDHIDHNGLNNQRNNMRICTHSENQMNRTIQKNNKTGFVGVSIRKYIDSHNIKRDKISAFIGHNNKMINLGSFKSEKEAAIAYDKAAKELYGGFANLNFKSNDPRPPQI